jgi:hypothetical protein
MYRIGAVFAAALLAGCDPNADDAMNRQCTARGCGSAFQLAFDRRSVWAPGMYTVEVTADGAKSTCEVTIPLVCNQAPRCSAGAGWSPILSGCALDPGQHAVAGLIFEKTAPARVEVQVLDRGRRIGMGSFMPIYKMSQPNGPGCEPTCRSAPIEELALTP